MKIMTINKKALAYIIGILIAIIWGTTFISSKILLNTLQPIEIVVYRFTIGYIVLTMLRPKPMPFLGWKTEGWCFLAGLCGVTFYFLFENFALQYTTAGNVGVIVTTAPIFTAILAFFFLKEEKLSGWFFIGFVVAMVGILFVNLETVLNPHFSTKGFLLAIGAAFIWAAYSVILKKKVQLKKYMLESTKRIFFYGIISAIPFFLVFGIDINLIHLAQKNVLGNLLFLGVGASALCYWGFNWTIEVLGAVKASAYIYFIPVVTFIVAHIVLHEELTIYTGIGAALTITGLILAEKRTGRKKTNKKLMMY